MCHLTCDYLLHGNKLLVGSLLIPIYAHPYVDLIWVIIPIGLFLQMEKRVDGTWRDMVKHSFW